VKLLAAVVAAAVLLLTAGTVWFGARVREDTVVSHPYEEGLASGHHAGRADGARPPDPSARWSAPAPTGGCDLGSGPCTRTLGDLELTLELSPRPPRPMTELQVQGRLARGGVPVDGAEIVLSFEMAGMTMGENLARLAAAGGGRYRGTAVLIRCTSGRRDWNAAALVRSGGEGWSTSYALRVSE
jgi:hypothetical protein